MKRLIKVIATFIAVGMLMLSCVGLNSLLVGMAAVAALALVAKGHWANAARDGPQHKKAMFYRDPFGVQFQRSDFAMTPPSRSYGGMGRPCRCDMFNVRRVHDGITRRLAGLKAKLRYRMYNPRDSNGHHEVARFGLHQRESLALGYH